MTLDDYIDDAKAGIDAKSDRQLDRYLGFNSPACSHYRKRRCRPSEATMARMAELGGHDPELALLDLQIMEAQANHNEHVEELFKNILSKVIAAANIAA